VIQPLHASRLDVGFREQRMQAETQRQRHGVVDLSQYILINTAGHTTCTDCGRSMFMLHPRGFGPAAAIPTYYLCVCGAIREAGYSEPIALSEEAPYQRSALDELSRLRYYCPRSDCEMYMHQVLRVPAKEVGCSACHGLLREA
jgi:hypothetical protein